MSFDQTKAITSLEHIVGTTHVLSNPSDMTGYLTDWRGDYHGKALAVVKPANTAEVSAIMKLADELEIAIIPQGGNTSLCGAATPDDQNNNLILSTERLNRIRDIDIAGQTITVESGCILDVIKSTATEHDLLFPLDLGARGTCRIGGNLSTNAGGLNVIRYGNMRDLTLGLEVVLIGGKVMNLLSSLKKNNTGYDLKNLFIGAEGT
ncbi:MAG: FAD-binding oxidoreductase, partial [Candidatus Puniceispirillales bacterium]